jgi:hypothetical protein
MKEGIERSLEEARFKWGRQGWQELKGFAGYIFRDVYGFDDNGRRCLIREIGEPHLDGQYGFRNSFVLSYDIVK